MAPWKPEEVVQGAEAYGRAVPIDSEADGHGHALRPRDEQQPICTGAVSGEGVA
eukprot:CAMPEP_0202761978 /NCGR_PEP_ID=MMETSP1388-20130828/20610_1 /ASSEMBLY_ACC=CAM_ASM_000864 /TAXON_ID=37098 /ORGANISM="Isochrysis sp, Strain CCMP1244" /LENGTH=53 /DNA_ID=CAMNT_0049430159 /DNA_START=115 /DNA_END=272 /DNA_ORIENTATION=-